MTPVITTTGTEYDESDLVERLRSGDESAFEELVRTHAPRVLASSRRLLGNEEDARDVTQETFLAVFRSLHRFREEARLGTWISKIAVNQCLMKLRSRRRRPETSIEDLLPKFLADGHQVEATTRWRPTAESELEEKETRALVRSRIDQLPTKYRTVLLLRDIEEKDTETVATILGVNANTVKVRLHRARQALRALLEPDFRQPSPVLRTSRPPSDRESAYRARDGATL